MKKGDIVKVINDPDWLKLRILRVEGDSVLLSAPNSNLPSLWVKLNEVTMFSPRPYKLQ